MSTADDLIKLGLLLLSGGMQGGKHLMPKKLSIDLPARSLQKIRLGVCVGGTTINPTVESPCVNTRNIKATFSP